MKQFLLVALLFVGMSAITAKANDEGPVASDELTDSLRPQAAYPSRETTFIPGHGYVYYTCPWGWSLRYGTFVQYQYVLTPYGYQLYPVYVNGYFCTYP